MDKKPGGGNKLESFSENTGRYIKDFSYLQMDNINKLSEKERNEIREKVSKEGSEERKHFLDENISMPIGKKLLESKSKDLFGSNRIEVKRGTTKDDVEGIDFFVTDNDNDKIYRLDLKTQIGTMSNDKIKLTIWKNGQATNYLNLNRKTTIFGFLKLTSSYTSEEIIDFLFDYGVKADDIPFREKKIILVTCDELSDYLSKVGGGALDKIELREYCRKARDEDEKTIKGVELETTDGKTTMSIPYSEELQRRNAKDWEKREELESKENSLASIAYQKGGDILYDDILKKILKKGLSLEESESILKDLDYKRTTPFPKEKAERIKKALDNYKKTYDNSGTKGEHRKWTKQK